MSQHNPTQETQLQLTVEDAIPRRKANPVHLSTKSRASQAGVDRIREKEKAASQNQAETVIDHVPVITTHWIQGTELKQVDRLDTGKLFICGSEVFVFSLFFYSKVKELE